MSATRRALLAGLGCLPLALHAQAARSGFGAKTVAEALQQLGLSGAQRSSELELIAPELSENGARVPLTLRCGAPNVRRLLLLSERNVVPLIAVLEPGAAVEPRLQLEMKLAQSGNLLLLAQLADGRLLSSQRELRVTLGGCDSGSPEETAPALAPQPSLIRARLAGAGALVRLRMRHDMETGQRLDARGRAVPLWHISEAQLFQGETLALGMQFGPGVAKDPLLAVPLRKAAVGEGLRLQWRDTRGATRSDSAQIEAAAS